MAVPGVKSDQPFLIPQKRAASIPDSAPIPKKLNNATRTTRKRSNNKRDDSSEPENSKSTENLTEGEVFRHLEAVRTEMATISWYMDLPEKLKIPEILREFLTSLVLLLNTYWSRKVDFSILNMPNGRIRTQLISGWCRDIGSRMRLRRKSTIESRRIRRREKIKKPVTRKWRANQQRTIMKMLCRKSN